MPNDTDFSVFKKLGVVGLNFAFVGNWEDYHTTHDNPATLDRGSLQHHGATAVALARRFGAADLADAAGAQTRCTSRCRWCSGWSAIRRPGRCRSRWPALALAVWALVRARRRKLASLGGLLLALLVFAILSAAAGYWGWRFAGIMDGAAHAVAAARQHRS